MKRFLIITLTLLALALSGCSLFRTPPDPIAISEESPSPSPTVAPTVTPQPQHDRKFTLLWSKDSSMNPLTSANPDNLRLGGLIFESLIKVAQDYSVVPVLCESWSSDDGIHWTFVLRDDIPMHDGTLMSIFDVIGSINAAREGGRFVSRLSNINNVGASDGNLTVTLKTADYDFPSMLEIPIMKDRTAYSRHPVGSGPYVLGEIPGEIIPSPTIEPTINPSDNPDIDPDVMETPEPIPTISILNAFTAYRDFGTLPVPMIYLTEVEHEDLIPAFDSGLIDLVFENKSNAGSMEYSAGAERRSFVTNIMHFVGFNPWRTFCSDPIRRKIIASIIDRSEITIQSLTDTEASVLPLPPGSPYYNQEIAQAALIPRDELETWIASSSIADYDGNGTLDMLSATGSVQEIELRFIVHRDNLKKVNAAKHIAEMLHEYGFTVNLEELSWEAYQRDVSDGNFDLYYGSVQISPNFSLKAMFDDSGSARSVAYDATLDMLASEFQSALPGEIKDTAAAALLTQFCEYLPLTPIAFERGAVLTNRGIVTNATATQYNAFYNIAEWQINLD